MTVRLGAVRGRSAVNLLSRSRIRNPQPTQIDRQEPAQRAERRAIVRLDLTDFRLDFTEARELGQMLTFIFSGSPAPTNPNSPPRCTGSWASTATTSRN
jgi:hypothetical protein